MDDLESLELLSLVFKVTSELQNHLGISDKTLAEFVIAQHAQCKTTQEFQKKLEDMGAEFPQSLIESIDRLVKTIHPKYQQKNVTGEVRKGIEEKSKVFKGLALPDKELPWKHETSDLNVKKESDAIDDTLALLEDLEPKVKVEKSSDLSQKRKQSNKGEYYGVKKASDGSKKKSKTKHNSSHKNYNSEEEDEYGRSRKFHRSSPHRKGNYELCRRSPSPEIDNYPVEYKIYDGHVTGVRDFGCFVNLHGVKGRVVGLVHVSALVEGQRVNHPLDLVTYGQHVKVKVVRIEGDRIGLSMKDVDQETGRDLVPYVRIQSGANTEQLGGRRDEDNKTENKLFTSNSNFSEPYRPKKRMTSPERWEIRQLIASGVMKASDYPDLDEDYNAALNGEGSMGLEEEIDIELREEEPPFLAGQTKQSLELSPIRVVKAPDGSLNRAAMAGTTLAKDRRELRQQEAQDKAAQESSKVDLSTQWNDPMVQAEERRFASDLRATKPKPVNEAVPEWKKVTQSKNQSFGRRTDMTIQEQRKSLPVYRFQSELIKAVNENQLLIVVGDTGSGKTTQLTQYLVEAGYADYSIIGCTQPRRVAAMSVAKRVAEEVGCRLGQEVGYTIRFEDMTSQATKIKYMTDGMLQREILLDPDLKRYSVIMLDEAHERTIATDVLFALLKKTIKRRPDLKVIVTSATLDADKFSAYFNECPIFSIPGRTFPVEIMYSKEPESDYLDAALVTVIQIHLTEPPGDILLFLTGQEEIDTSCEILFERMKALGNGIPELIILPVYSALPSEMQSKIFDPAPPGSRKVVIATNIAETSITIDHIYYVIDPGFVKQNAYDPKLGMDSLVVTPISQAQAKQRAGRAGRTGPGKCFRLYTEAAFQSEMLPTSIPEIQRQNLSNTILMLKAMGINDLLHFDFMDPPPTNTMLTALEELYALSALDDEGLLTRLGRKMADFPMDPSMAKVVIAAVNLGCCDEILSIVAMLSLPTVFYRPKEKQAQADHKKAQFHDHHGDHLTLLNVYNSWKRSGYTSAWCFDNFIQARSMRRARDVREQLVKIMKCNKYSIESCGQDTQKVRQAFCSGFFRNSARKDPQEGYKTLIEGTPVYLHPSSALFGKQAEWVIYHTLVLTSKEYMHCTTSIEPKWLVEAAPSFFRVAPTDRLSKRKKSERIQPLYNKFAADDEWRLSAQKRQGRGGGGGTWG